MVLRASFQRRDGGAWQTLADYGPYTSATFADDASNHAFSQPFTWWIRDEDLGGVFRWRVLPVVGQTTGPGHQAGGEGQAHGALCDVVEPGAAVRESEAVP